MTDSRSIKLKKGVLSFEDKYLSISDDQAIRLSKIALCLLALVMLATVIKGFEFIDFSSWLMLPAALAWLFPLWILYSLRNTSDIKSIEYDQIENVKYKKTHYGFRNPVLEVLFKNEKSLLKKRYIHVKPDQVEFILVEFKIRCA